MKTEALKKKIKKKFKTFSNFCRIAEIDRYEFQKSFTIKEDVNKEFYNWIANLVAKNDNAPSRELLTKDKIKLIKEALDEQGGVIEFCRANDQFSHNTVFQILSGRYTTVSRVVRDLMVKLEIE